MDARLLLISFLFCFLGFVDGLDMVDVVVDRSVVILG